MRQIGKIACLALVIAVGLAVLGVVEGVALNYIVNDIADRSAARVVELQRAKR